MSNIELKTTVSHEPLDIKNLLNGSLEMGDGVLNKLLNNLRCNISREYEENKLKGTEYAKVYLGMYSSTLAEAIKFLLSKELQAYEIAKLEAETALIEANKAYKDEEKKLLPKRLAQIEAETDLVKTNKAFREEEKKLLPEKLAQIKAETDLVKTNKIYRQEEQKLLPQKLKLMLAETDLVKTNKAYRLEEQKLLPQKLKLIEAEVKKIPKELELLNQRVEMEKAKVLVTKEQLAIAKQELELKKQELELKRQQKDLIASQKALVENKAATEKAQIDPTDVKKGSSIYWQNQILRQQKQGFIDDVLLKKAKMATDSWSVRRTTDDSEAVWINNDAIVKAFNNIPAIIKDP